jgi:hypothetical protein
MDTRTARDYLLANFEPADRLAVVAINRSIKDVKQRVASLEDIARNDFQSRLQSLNKDHYDVYISMNTVRNNSNGRKKSDIAQIRHVYLDFDNDGTQAMRDMMTRSDMPKPNHLIASSPGKWQAIWRVGHFEPSQAEELMRAMVRAFGADPAATDSARVLRLPGFLSHKYQTPHLITVQNLSDQTYSPSQFPQFAIRVAADESPIHAFHSKPSREHKVHTGISQSERDWAYAKRALTRGEDPETVIQTIAAYRPDKPDPQYYARHTVTKAAAGIDIQSKPKEGLSFSVS